ncbi:beta strand repeat-containing protein [Mesocricetibacter intestinalis]|uniref:beta strand repeat-containing protein n=1 Tax=Mesocricetibacter intestinalis TaxID=1521930 RepID=UPI001AAC5117|nr:YadA-like family protein [Mesocricetibacter intestinalis]
MSGAQLNNAVNVGDLKNATKDITDNTLGKVGFNLTTTANGGESQVDANLSSEDKRIANNDTFSLNAGKNITVKQVKDGYEIATGNNLVIGEKGEPGQNGQNGKDGVDGSIGVNGKDGSSVVINGKDGSIGLTGPAGKDGKDGANANISVAEGKTTVNPKDGDNNITRIVYNTTNPDGTTTTREVATMDDGLKFKGDDNQEIAKQLGETLAITGGLTDANKLADNNIGVVKGEDGLVVKLAKDLANLTSVTTIGDNGTTKVSGDGIVIDPNAEGKGNVSLTGNGLDNGGNTITNVSSGLVDAEGNPTDLANATGTNAVNVGDLNATVNNLTNSTTGGFGLTDDNGDAVKADLGKTVSVIGDGSVTTNVVTNEDGTKALQVALSNNVTVGEKGADGKPGADGSIGVNGKDGSSVVINGKDGSIGLNGKDGKDGLTIKGEQGPAGVNGKNGENVTRIVYQPTDENGQPKGEPETVATLNDGLKFQGDSGDAIAKKLNETLTIKGGLTDANKLADNNIGVVNDNGSLVVKLAKDLANLTSVTTTGDNGTTKVDGDGITISPTAPGEGKGDVKLTGNGLDNGGNTITNVSSNLAGTDNNTTAAPTTLADGNTLDNATLSNGATLGDVLNAGWNLQGNGDAKDFVKHGDTVNFTDGVGTKVNITTNGSISNIKFDTTSSYVDADGKLTPNATNSVKFVGANESAPVSVTNVDSGVLPNGTTLADGQSFSDALETAVNNGNGTNVVNVNDLHQATKDITDNTLDKVGFNLTTVANGGESQVEENLTDEEKRIANNDTFTLNAGKNITVKQVKDGYEIATGNNLVIGEKGEPGQNGQNGKDGVDGSIGVNGKDGSSVVINGKDGSIGLNGKDGKDGLTIKGEQGPAGVNGKNGENVTRIVYQPTGENGQPKGDPETVATLNDGLKFQGDSGDAIAKKLNETLTIKGGLTDANKLADNNIGVVNDNGSLVVKLAKDLANLTSVTTTGDNGTTKVDGDGITISPTAPGEGKGDVKLTGNGLDNGGNTITNVSSNLAGTDNNTTAAPTTLADGNTLDNATLSNGASLGDVLNAGWNLQGNGDAKDFVKHGDTVNFTDGVGTKVNITTNGSVSNIKFDTTSSYVDADGKLTPNATNSVKFVGTNESAPVSVTNVDSGVLPNGTTLADGQSFNDVLNNVSGAQLNNAVNVGDLQNATKDITDNTLGKVGFNLTTVANGGESQVEENLTDEDKRIANNDTFSLNAGKNITVKQVKDGYEIATGNNLVIGEKGEAGQDGQNGKDGVDGSIGVNGKDGSSVVINGKDGSIGLTGPAGKDGVNGKDGLISANIKLGEGQTTVEPKDGGKEITRVVYETTRPVLDAEGNPQKDENGNIIMENVTREVATMDDGLKFQGDKGEVIAKKLGETLAIKGNLDSNATVTDKNLRVDNEDGALVVKMAKDLQELTSISLSGDNASTVLNGEGIVIDPKADGKGNVSLTDKGLNNGGNTITNVANGTNGTDAVNLDQLNATGAASKTYVEEGQNVNVTSKTNKDGSTTYTVSTSNNIVVGEKGEAGQDGQNGKDGIDGSIGVNGKDGSSVVINGKDGSIGLTGPAGKDGVNGKDGLISANIKLGEGQTTVEPKDGGKEITRVVYETTRPVLDAEGNPQKDENGNIIMENVTREVATMDDGLKFQGDKGEVIAKKLGETLAIKGNLDSNATVTDKNLRVDNDNGTLVVKMAKDLQELTSISLSGDNVSTVLNGGGITISPTNPAEGKGNVSLTDKGLNNGGNTITNVANGTNGTDAVNLDQLNATGAASKTYVEEGQNVNVTSKTNKDGSTTYTVSTSNNIVVGEKGEAGQDGQNGKDGIDGSIGVNGKDGSSVVINGKDGSIGLTGPAGKDGVNGKDGLISANIKLGEGQTTVEPKDGGKEITRVVYETTRPVLDAEGNPQKDENGNIIMENVTREVATMDDGLKFQGDKGEVIAKKLGETLAIKGNLASNATVTDKNLRVDNDNGTLVVKMAKDLQELTSISLSGDNVSTVLNGGGITISPTNPAEGKGNVSLTDKGLNNGGNTITNVANGTNGTDAVNLDQLNATGAASKTYVEEGQNVNVTSKTNKDGSTTYTVSTSNNIVVGEKGEAGQDGQNGKDGIDGSIGVNGKDGSSVVINGKDGSIGLNGKDGKDGLTIKGAQGPAGVDGKDGETTTRIVYQPKDAEGNPTGKPETVATLNDGLKFQGDKGGVIAKKLNETLTIKGNLDSNATVTDKNLRVDNDSDSLVIKMAKDLADLSSVTTSNPNGTTKVSGDGISITPTNPAEGKGNVSLTGNGLDNGGNTITNVSSGLVDANGKPTDLSNATSSNAVNVGDLKNTVTDLTTDGFGLTDDKGTAVKADLGKTVSVIGDGSVKTQVVDGENGTKALQVALSNNVTVGEKGKDGQDGVDGTIGVNGKDGSAVVINGKDGSIGLNGKDGKDGLTIKGAQGPAGVDGKDGETTTRIVYQPKDAEGNPTGEPETVATLNDGLKFQGDKGGVIAKKLNETLTIKGNLDSNATVTDKNLRVDNDNDSLVIKMAKDLADLSSVTTSNPNGTTKVSGDGISITPTNPAEGKGNVSLTGNGLDNGGNTITNVSSGLVDADGNPTDLSNATSSNAVNVGDLKNTVTDLTTDGFGLTDDKGTAVKADLGKTVSVIGDGSVTTKVVDGENGTKALQVALSNNVTVGEKGKDGKDGVDGTIGVNGQDGSAVVINGKDGSIGLNGKDGKDGLTIKGGEGPAGVNGKDGETTTRIVYQPKDAEGNPTGKPETVATLNDGLKFQGDKGGVIAKKLNETLTIKGGADDDAEVADKNLRVDNIDGVLTVRMAKALTDLSSIGLTGSGSNTVINGGGITITPIAQDKKPVSLTDSGLNNGGNTITNVAAGTNGTDAVNLDQLEASSAAAKTEVQAGKNVTINSTQGAKNQTIYTVNADKSVVSAGSDSVVVKAETDAANYTTTYQVDLSNEIKQQIAKEETVVGGKNITVTEGKNDTGGKEFTVNLDKDIDLGEDGSLQIGDTKVDNDGVTVGNTTLNGNGLTIKDGPSVTQSGIDAGNKQITNVTAAVNGTDAVNLSQLNSTVASAGFNLTTNGDTSEIDAMSAEDKSKATRVNTDETFALNQNATHNNIIVKQIDNGYELAANNNFVVGEKGSDSAAGNKGGADGSITVNGKEGATIVINGADGSIVVSGKDGANIVINGADGSISVKGKDGADATITVSNGKGTLDAPAQGGDGITRITYNTNNADGSTTTRQVATMDDGLSFKGDSGESINRKLGSTLNIVGGQTDSSKLSDNNIGVVSSGDKLTVKLSKALTGLTSVQTSDAEGNTVVQNGSGITITPAGNPARTVSLTTKGLNNGGNRITNVAPGVEPTDAVNVSQLNGITQGFNNRIAQAEARADAGTATAMATAGIPQAYIPGKSLVGVGGSTYRGQQAYAVGISSISDGGNWIIKGSVSSNSRGSVGATVGAGYMW